MIKSNYIILYISCLLLSISGLNAANTISGYVLTDTGAPVAGCVVSDGFSVVQTDELGAYTFPRDIDSTQFVFISVPSGYEMPVDQNNLPLFYKKVPESPLDFSHTFTLKPFADGGAADMNHVMIGISDPQVQSNYDTYRFGTESIVDMREHAATFPEGTPVYGVVVGDIVWDQYYRFAEHIDNVSKVGFPVFHVIGNHDHDKTTPNQDDWLADHYFKDSFGPTYYSFNRGKIHYVTLDNIAYAPAYKVNIVDYQLEWLKKDLALVPDDMYIVFMVHGPFPGMGNRQAVYDLVAKRRNTHALSGHYHTLHNHEINSNFYDHTLGAVMGTYWSGNTATDGCPNGYGVFHASDKGYTNWYYKATGHDTDYQMRVYPPNSFVNGESMQDKIIANIWNYDSKWSEVNIYENGEKYIMYQYTGIDPLIHDFNHDHGDTRPNYPGSDGGTLAHRNPGTDPTNHFFYYTPKDPNADFEVEVTDRNKKTYRVPVLKNIMVATFEEDNGEYYYRQDFNSYVEYPNHFVNPQLAKCTFVQGHSPMGWYATTSGAFVPNGTNDVRWDYFNYLLIDNGSSPNGAIYAYGEGDPATPTGNDPDRSLGTVLSTMFKNIHLGVMIENNTGQTIHGLELDYKGKMWRGGRTPQNLKKMLFSYAVNPDIISIRKRDMSIGEVETIAIDSLSLLAPETNNAQPNSPCNGKDPLNQRLISGKINVKLYPGDVILLRWQDLYDRNSDSALALDDIEVKAVFTPTSVEEVKYNPSFYSKGFTVYFDEVPGVVSLYDVSGVRICELNISAPTADFSNYVSPGIYFLQTTYGTKKLVFTK